MSSSPRAAAIDISCGHLIPATAHGAVGMYPAVVLSSDERLSARGNARPAHRLLCSPEVDDLAREQPGTVISEPWALIDSSYTRIEGVAIGFEEIAGATLRRAQRWLAAQAVAPANQVHLVIPTNWGNVRIARALDVAGHVGISAAPIRAALLLADALTSSFATWIHTVELSNKGAVVSLVRRDQRTLTVVASRVVLRVDPDDDTVDGFPARVIAVVFQLRDGHRPARSGSQEVLVCGVDARAIITEFDARRLLSFPVPAQALAEAATTLPIPLK